MKRSCVAIVDAARARIYACEAREPGDGGNGVQRGFPCAPPPAVDLVNASGARGDPFAPAAPAPPGAGDDEHGAARRFARQVIAAIERFVGEQACDRVLVVASPTMLERLRRARDGMPHHPLAIEYVARDLARLISPQIDDRPARDREVSPPQPPAFARG